MVTDLTAKKDLEHQTELVHRKLQSAAKLSGLGEVAANIAHEINNPLTIIASSADVASFLLKKSVPEGSAILGKLSAIQGGVERISQIVKSIKSL